MLAIFIIFIVEIVAFRWGTAKLASIGISADPHGHMNPAGASHAAHGPESGDNGDRNVLSEHGAYDDSEKGRDASLTGKKDVEMAVLNAAPSSVVDSPATQIIGVGILEFGVLLHR